MQRGNLYNKISLYGFSCMCSHTTLETPFRRPPHREWRRLSCLVMCLQLPTVSLLNIEYCASFCSKVPALVIVVHCPLWVAPLRVRPPFPSEVCGQQPFATLLHCTGAAGPGEKAGNIKTPLLQCIFILCSSTSVSIKTPLGRNRSQEHTPVSFAHEVRCADTSCIRYLLHTAVVLTHYPLLPKLPLWAASSHRENTLHTIKRHHHFNRYPRQQTPGQTSRQVAQRQNCAVL